MCNRPTRYADLSTLPTETSARKSTVGSEQLAKLWPEAQPAPDLFGGRIPTPVGAKVGELLVSESCGPVEVLRRVAKQGMADSGVGIWQREDRLARLSAALRTIVILTGTGPNGSGSRLQLQLDYRTSAAGLGALLELAELPRVQLSKTRDETTARLNLEGRVGPDGIHDLRGGFTLANLPAVELGALLTALSDEDFDLPVGMPLKILEHPGHFFRLDIDAERGVTLAARTTVGSLESFSVGLPAEAVVTLFAAGQLQKVASSPKPFVQLTEVEASLDSKLRLLWPDGEPMRLEYEDPHGTYRPIDLAERWDVELTETLLAGALSQAARSLG